MSFKSRPVPPKMQIEKDVVKRMVAFFLFKLSNRNPAAMYAISSTVDIVERLRKPSPGK